MNNNTKCIGVDDFSESNVRPMTDHLNWTEVKPYDTLVKYWEKYENGNATFVKSSIDELEKKTLMVLNQTYCFMMQIIYDGTDEQLEYVLPFLDDQFILVETMLTLMVLLSLQLLFYKRISYIF